MSYGGRGVPSNGEQTIGNAVSRRYWRSPCIGRVFMDRRAAFLASAALVAFGCFAHTTAPATTATDPRTCPPAPGPASGTPCSKAGMSCHYYAHSCSNGCTCNGETWSCGESNRFGCGDCASDVRCTSGTTCAPSQGGGSCSCGDDGVFACMGPDQAASASLPACPLQRPEVGSTCPALSQECDYIDSSCTTVFRCTSGKWNNDTGSLCGG